LVLLNYIKFAFRNLVRNRSNSIINIAGLTIGLASFIIIALYIQDELSYDRYHKNADRIYRVIQQGDFNGIVETSTSCPFPLSDELMESYPDLIESSVRFFNFQSPRTMLSANGKNFSEKHMFYTDSSVFDVFDIQFIKGEKDSALNDKFKCVITKSTAIQYFGSLDVLGDTIIIEDRLPVVVCGVISDVPCQSHFTYNVLISMKTIEYLYGGKLPDTWVWNPCWTYIVLKPGVTPGQIEEQFPAFIEKNICVKENRDRTSFFLQPLTDIHLKSNLDYEIQSNGNMSNIYIIGFVALFLLVFACINFINLSTVSSVKREREIGIKKVHGAGRLPLILQFLGETFFITLIAFFFSLLAVEVSLPFFNNLFEKNLYLSSLLNPRDILLLISLLLFTGIAAGIYPAFYLSSFVPIKSLQRNFLSGMNSGWPRKILVISQFTIAALFITGALMSKSQTRFLKNADLGFEKDQIILLETAMSPLSYYYDSIKNELLTDPDIISVTGMDYIIGIDHNTHEFRPEGTPDNQWLFFPALVVREDFLKTFDIEIVAGRDFSNQNDNDKMNAILINEAMVKHMGWKSNQDALGKKFFSGFGKERVVGVFKDFKVSSLHKPTGPFVLNMKEDDREIGFYTKYIAIRVSNSNRDKVISHIEKVWKQFDPERPFEYMYLNEELDKLYKKEDVFSELIFIFTVITLLLAGIGLYGLTTFLTGQKMKEMGIRRIFGATGWNIIVRLNRNFLLLVTIANILSWPVAYLIIERWLENFAYTITIQWWVFPLSFLFTALLCVTIVTVKGIHAARSNPVDTLKVN